MVARSLVLVVAVGATVAVVATIPFVLTAIEFRQRDNGLSYIMFALGIGVWNGMLVAQLLSPRPLIKGFFLALTIVGSLIAGLGWFLFAGTASSTPAVPNQRVVYGSLAVLVGLDIAAAVTAPVHTFYWVLRPEVTQPAGFAVIEPGIGYWLHALLLGGLFAGGTVLFASVWQDERNVRYTRAYSIIGTLTVASIAVSGFIAPGGFSVTPLLAATLATIGWIQARRGRVFRFVRTVLG